MDYSRAGVAVIAMLLSGCELIDEQRDPVAVECKAECVNADYCALQCTGNGPLETKQTTKIKGA
jgi:hypothetical protein